MLNTRPPVNTRQPARAAPLRSASRRVAPFRPSPRRASQLCGAAALSDPQPLLAWLRFPTPNPCWRAARALGRERPSSGAHCWVGTGFAQTPPPQTPPPREAEVRAVADLF
jgi:hypothetical protein